MAPFDRTNRRRSARCAWLWLLALTGCRPPAPAGCDGCPGRAVSTQAEAPGREAAIEALRRAVAGDLVGFQGLTGMEDRQLLAAALGPYVRATEEERVRLGWRYRVLTIERTAAPRRIEAWFPVGDGGSLAVLEWEPPPGVDLEGLVGTWGAPDQIVKERRAAPGAVVEELLYVRRGATLSAARPVDQANAGVRSLAHVQLYAPTTVVHWHTRIGAGPELHPYPRDEGPRSP
ncbi:hypothetical protein BE08_37850 [Sorangium cellulosum]|uniref:DUF3261 domain-containing protein n=1 Tax=Sorangium cellulosum TaxID=56 RepID=A0A150PRD9_SORCE|nr:hypothetical protein BE08_37850 [Sorangium cellulosum]